RTLFIQTETTPNDNALKFLPGAPLLPPTCPPTTTIEYLSGRTSHSSPLARKLFALDGITSVFFTPEYLTVTKAPDANWAHLKPEVFSLITEFLNCGAPVVLGEVGEDGVWRAGDGESSVGGEDTAPREGDSEVVSMIKELLDTRIRPAIQEDGGDIEFRGFDEDSGVVRLKLRGACRTCDSSTVTLRNGIESMLMHYVEEVKSVEQVLDQEEEIALKEFEKFEEKLRKA
ncbi:HIRA-interacting protein 5, partial [Terfezia boudieri ATCC MYA-4762]